MEDGGTTMTSFEDKGRQDVEGKGREDVEDKGREDGMSPRSHL